MKYEESKRAVFDILEAQGLIPRGKELTLDTRFVEDLGLESLEATELLINLQDRTGVDLMKYLGRMPTVKDVVNALYLEKRD